MRAVKSLVQKMPNEALAHCYYRACCDSAKEGFGTVAIARWAYCPWCGEKLEREI